MAKSIKRAGMIFFVLVVSLLIVVGSLYLINFKSDGNLKSDESVVPVNAVPEAPELEYHLSGSDAVSMATLWNEKMQEAQSTRKHIKLILDNDWTAPTTNEIHSFGSGLGFDGGRILVPHYCTITLDLNGNTIDRGLSIDNPVSLGNVIKVNGVLNLTDNTFNSEEAHSIFDNNPEDLKNYPCGKITGGSRIDNVYGGGAIFVEVNATFNMTGGLLINNYGKNGGAIHIRAGSIANIYDGIIVNNSAVNGGGIYFATEKKTIINNAIIYNNNATNGGGVYLDSGVNCSMDNVKIKKCHTLSNGGGIYVNRADLNATNISITDCSCNVAAAGGAICVSGGSLNLNTFNINNNTATYGGGVVFVSESDGKLENGNINNNTATISGGAIHIVESSSVDVINCAISNNISEVDGGGVFIGEKARISFKDTKITENSTKQSGGGIMYYSPANLSIGGKFECSANTSTDKGSDNISLQASSKIYINEKLEKYADGSGIFVNFGINSDKFLPFTVGFSSYGNNFDPSTLFKTDDGDAVAKTIDGEVIFDYYGDSIYDYIYLEDNIRKNYKANDYLHGVNDSTLLQNVNGGKLVLGGISPNTSIKTFLDTLGFDKTKVTLIDNKGNDVFKNNAPVDASNYDSGKEYAVGTGWRVIYNNNGNTEEIYLSVLGDINGDGRISASDVATLREIANNKAVYENLSVEIKLASMVINKGNVTTADAEIVKNVIDRLFEINLFF